MVSPNKNTEVFKMKIKYLKEYDKQRVGIRTKSKRRIEYGILNVDLKRYLVTFKTDSEEIILLPSEITEIKINEKLDNLKEEGK